MPKSDIIEATGIVTEALPNLMFRVKLEAREILAFSSTDDVSVAMGKDFDEYIKKRVQNKIRLKIIMRNSERARRFQKTGSTELREVRIIEPAFEYHNLIFIWNDKVAMLSSGKDFVTYVIEDKFLVKFYKTTFNYIWETLA